MNNPSTAKPLLERPAILVLDAPEVTEAPERAVLAAAGMDAELLTWEGRGAATDEAALARADAILTWHTDIDEAMIRQARRCLAILHYGPGSGPGVARVAQEAARQAGIYVASIPDFATPSWVEETFRLIRQLTHDTEGFSRRVLAGMRLGLVGFGQVGRGVAEAARRKKMEVWACDPFAPPEPFLTVGAMPADLATLCGVADILSLHVPLGPATRGTIGAEQLMLMKRDSLLIVTADPGLVDLDALGPALERGRPAAAAFDEDLTARLPREHPLLSQPRLVYGPRRAGVGEAWNAARRRRAVELLVRLLQGQRPDHLLIDPPCPRHILLMAGHGAGEG